MRKRVLVVDDVPDWRAQLQAILKADYDVTTVDSYEAALEIYPNHRDAQRALERLRGGTR